MGFPFASTGSFARLSLNWVCNRCNSLSKPVSLSIACSYSAFFSPSKVSSFMALSADASKPQTPACRSARLPTPRATPPFCVALACDPRAKLPAACAFACQPTATDCSSSAFACGPIAAACFSASA